MKRLSTWLSIFLAATVLFVLTAPGVRAQENAEEETVTEEEIETGDQEELESFLDLEPEKAVETVEDVKEVFAEDKTGTNPMNFTFDARLYNEYRWLNVAGGGHQNVTTFEFRAPFGDRQWQFRTRIPVVGLTADFNDDGIDDVDETGLGDINVRFMTIPYLSLEKKMAVAVGVEAFFNTASKDALGTGATSLAPLIFLGFFNPIGPGSIFVPGYQHTISVDEDPGRPKVRQGLIDMFLVKTFADGQHWGYIDPQIVIDYEAHTEFMLFEIQAGSMLKWGGGGHSFYVMPSIGVGADRPYNFSFELGYKIVW